MRITLPNAVVEVAANGDADMLHCWTACHLQVCIAWDLFGMVEPMGELTPSSSVSLTGINPAASRGQVGHCKQANQSLADCRQEWKPLLSYQMIVVGSCDHCWDSYCCRL